SPYSLRGRAGAPVSMPLNWEDLANTTDPVQFNIHNVVEKVVSEGDAWEGIASYSVPLHTQRKDIYVKKELPKSPKHKSPGQLKEYETKRDFSKTSEPKGMEDLGTGNAFVVHRHHATRLHYDLRLEEDGVLKSWAVPKGLPQRPGIKR